MLAAVYGTLRAGFGNHYLLDGATLVGTGITERRFIMLSSGFPVCLVPEDEDGGCAATVEVYDLSTAHGGEYNTLHRLDNLEGHPDWYKREEVAVRMEDGSLTVAWMYIMPGTIEDFPSWRLVPTGDWSAYRRGAA